MNKSGCHINVRFKIIKIVIVIFKDFCFCMYNILFNKNIRNIFLPILPFQFQGDKSTYHEFQVSKKCSSIYICAASAVFYLIDATKDMIWEIIYNLCNCLLKCSVKTSLCNGWIKEKTYKRILRCVISCDCKKKK